MKHYFQPETSVLQVKNSTVLCASGDPAPASTGTLGGMKIKVSTAWI